MALAALSLPTILILFLHLLPSIQVLSTDYSHSDTPPEAMIVRACEGVANQSSCLNNLLSELAKTSEPHRPRSPVSVLHAALKHTLDEAMRAQRVISGLAFPLSAADMNAREAIAVEDCKELIGFSVSEIGWSMAEMRRIRDGSEEPHSKGNLKAWLSAALSNQDTCLEGFDGTDHRLDKRIKGSLMQVTRLVSNVLSMYTEQHTLPFKQATNNTRNEEEGSAVEFPEWMGVKDQGILQDNRTGKIRADTVVAADGSGQHRTITEAVAAAPSYSTRRYVIYVKKGVYRENLDLKKKKTNIVLAGDGIGQTVVTGERNFVQGWTTFRTATVAVSGKGFIARDMTIRNTAGPTRYQAVALRVDSDQSAFYRCSIEGYQDTLYSHSLRQFFRECSIYGTIDFIFGNGAAVLQRCDIFTRRPLPLQKVTVTAQGRKTPHQSTGFSIQDSRVFATEPTYLGRPWKQYSRTVFMNTYMSSMVQPRGWLEWYGDFALSTLYYAEYENTGPGSNVADRVRWPGFHLIKDDNEAALFSVGRFIDGIAWLPSTGIRFSAGLRH